MGRLRAKTLIGGDMRMLNRSFVRIAMVAGALAAAVTLAAWAKPSTASRGPKIESSLTVDEALGPGVVSGAEVWLLVTRYETVVTRVVEPNGDGAAPTISNSGDSHRLLDSFSLVRLDMLSGTRRTVVEDGVIDLKADGRTVYGLSRLPHDRGYGVTAYRGEMRTLLGTLPLTKGDTPLSLTLDHGSPVVLTRRAVLRLRPGGRRWSTTLLGERLNGDAMMASPRDGGSVFAVAAGGVIRIDLGSGVVSHMALPKAFCPADHALPCDGVAGMAADPRAPDCVLGATGVTAKLYSHGGVIRLCRDKAEFAWDHPVTAPAASTAMVMAVAPTGEGFWAATRDGGLFLVRGAESKPFKVDHSRNLGGLRVTCLADALAISSRAGPNTASDAAPGGLILIADPERNCQEN
jgi:hypothetical protein